MIDATTDGDAGNAELLEPPRESLLELNCMASLDEAKPDIAPSLDPSVSLTAFRLDSRLAATVGGRTDHFVDEGVGVVAAVNHMDWMAAHGLNSLGFRQGERCYPWRPTRRKLPTAAIDQHKAAIRGTMPRPVRSPDGAGIGEA